MKQLTFYKDSTGWYAQVAGHTKAQNKMVAGSDDFLDMVNAITGSKDLVTVKCDDKPVDDPSMTLMRIVHMPFGAFYVVKGKYAEERGLDGNVIFLCNVAHTVFKKHPKRIYIKEIF